MDEKKVNKKLSYHRGTARHAMSVETAQSVAQMFIELHFQGHAVSLEMAHMCVVTRCLSRTVSSILPFYTVCDCL